MPQVFATINIMANGEMTFDDLNLIYQLEKNILKLDLFEPIKEEKIEIPQEVISLANQRITAKAGKNYALADELRKKVEELGYAIKDTKEGFEIEKIS